MLKAFVRSLAVLGAIYLLTIVVALFLVAGRKGSVPSKTLLEANFEQPLVEDIPETPTSKLMLAGSHNASRRCGCD